MRTLIVEDEFTSRIKLQRFLEPYSECEVVVNGKEGVEAFRLSFKEGFSYDLICLDIIMPEMDGQDTLRKIRDIEKENGVQCLDRVKIMMTTSLDDSENVMESFRSECEAYLPKPFTKKELLNNLQFLGLLKEANIKS